MALLEWRSLHMIPNLKRPILICLYWIVWVLSRWVIIYSFHVFLKHSTLTQWIETQPLNLILDCGRNDSTLFQIWGVAFIWFRNVRKEKLDRIVMFANDSNTHNMELFDELVGWHIFNLLRYTGKNMVYINDWVPVLPRKLEWVEFMLNIRLIWKDVNDKLEWIKDLTFFVCSYWIKYIF